MKIIGKVGIVSMGICVICAVLTIISYLLYELFNIGSAYFSTGFLMWSIIGFGVFGLAEVGEILLNTKPKNLDGAKE